MLLRALREEVLAANLDLVRRGVVVFTFGNVSGISRKDGLVAIKPSGVPYEELTAEQIVVTDLDGRVDGDQPAPVVRSADASGALQAFPEYRRRRAHTFRIRHRRGRRRERPIPCFGTTHADYFHGPVPVTPDMTPEEIAGEYEKATGEVIVRTFPTSTRTRSRRYWSPATDLSPGAATPPTPCTTPSSSTISRAWRPTRWRSMPRRSRWRASCTTSISPQARGRSLLRAAEGLGDAHDGRRATACASRAARTSGRGVDER